MPLQIEMYPESYNKLRKLLHEQFPELFAYVGWSMAHDHLMFLRLMNEYTGILCLPELGIEECCNKYMEALWKIRPIIQIH